MGHIKTKYGPSVPDVALCATSNNIKPMLSTTTTLRRGELLGIVRPTWIKVTESEQRLSWLKNMERKKLIVRDIESYAKSVSNKLRSDELKYREEERSVLLGLMSLKVKDEKLNLRKLQRLKENRKEEILKEVGKTRQYDTLMRKLRKETLVKKKELKKKYNAKLEHLEKVRRAEEEEKWNRRTVPIEIEEFHGCIVFDKGKLEAMKPSEVDSLVIGKVEIDDDEKAILKLNPKFAVMTKLEDESFERKVEVGLAKLKYEIRKQKERELENAVDIEDNDNRKKIKLEEDDEKEMDKADAKSRQVFDPINKIFDYSKRRVTDLKENTKVYLPKLGDVRDESEIEMIRDIMMSTYKEYKKEINKRNKLGLSWAKLSLCWGLKLEFEVEA